MNVELLEEDANSTVKMVQVKSFGEKISVLSSNSDSRVTFSWIVMVCYELVADWGNPAFLIVKVILGFLQNKSNILEAIIRWCHENVAHGGRGITLNILRQNEFWILSANIVVREMIFRYVNCRKLRGKFGVKKMADLRKVGCLKVPPFTQRGVDMFEPFTIRERKSDLKRFCALHIEVTIN